MELSSWIDETLAFGLYPSTIFHLRTSASSHSFDHWQLLPHILGGGREEWLWANGRLSMIGSHVASNAPRLRQLEFFTVNSACGSNYLVIWIFGVFRRPPIVSLEKFSKFKGSLQGTDSFRASSETETPTLEALAAALAALGHAACQAVSLLRFSFVRRNPAVQRQERQLPRNHNPHTPNESMVHDWRRRLRLMQQIWNQGFVSWNQLEQPKLDLTSCRWEDGRNFLILGDNPLSSGAANAEGFRSAGEVPMKVFQLQKPRAPTSQMFDSSQLTKKDGSYPSVKLWTFIFFKFLGSLLLSRPGHDSAAVLNAPSAERVLG